MATFSPSHLSKIRPAVVAGRFYPEDPEELRHLIASFLSEAPASDGPPPKAIIVPHAGYIYSGPIAASAYVRLIPAQADVKRVVLLGPSHHTPFSGLAASGANAFATPLDPVLVDTEAVQRLCTAGLAAVLDEAHTYEHSLEVHLPFLQFVLDDFQIVPLLVHNASDGEVSKAIDALWGGPETRFVISSDLSHYHDYAGARKIDLATARAIEQLRPQDIDEEQACGCTSIRGLLRAAREHDLSVRTVDLRSSGDTAGPRNNVVGYGAFTFEET